MLINDRRFLRDLMRAAGIDGDKQDSAFITLDKLEKIGQEAVIKELVTHEIASDSQAQSLVAAVASISAVDLHADTKTLEVSGLQTELPLYDLGEIAAQVGKICPILKSSSPPLWCAVWGTTPGLFLKSPTLPLDLRFVEEDAMTG